MSEGVRECVHTLGKEPMIRVVVLLYTDILLKK